MAIAFINAVKRGFICGWQPYEWIKNRKICTKTKNESVLLRQSSESLICRSSKKRRKNQQTEFNHPKMHRYLDENEIENNLMFYRDLISDYDHFMAVKLSSCQIL